MFAGKAYCPILHSRTAEIKALSKLPSATKDLIFPLFVLRPWPNAKDLSYTLAKILDAFGDRRFALDIDPFKKGSDSQKPAALEFNALFDTEGGYSNYYEYIAQSPSAIPVIQQTSGLLPDLDVQLEHVASLDRGAVLRLQHGTSLQPSLVASQVLAAYPETAIFIDMGWSTDLISREVWASGILTDLGSSNVEREIVIAGSSFPDSFKSKAKDELLTYERSVYESLVRRHNSLRLTYGDWGSTRTSKEPVPMGEIPPRIDYPRSRECVSFRRDGAESFEDIAKRMLRDDAWDDDLDIWGTYVIKATADGLPDGIKGQAAAAAARINIHLHRQTHFGAPGSFNDVDEPYVD